MIHKIKAYCTFHCNAFLRFIRNDDYKQGRPSKTNDGVIILLDGRKQINCDNKQCGECYETKHKLFNTCENRHQKFKYAVYILHMRPEFNSLAF